MVLLKNTKWDFKLFGQDFTFNLINCIEIFLIGAIGFIVGMHSGMVQCQNDCNLFINNTFHDCINNPIRDLTWDSSTDHWNNYVPENVTNEKPS